MVNLRFRTRDQRSQPPRSILVVDDSASIRKLVELTLRRDGFAVTSVSSGIAALAAVAEHTPDLILLDLMLDALDGFQITRALRAHPEFRQIPIVVLTGRDGEADRDTGFAAGVSDYLTKPFQPEQLMRVVRQQLTTETRNTSAGHERELVVA
jgi:CheY-like chemotaxis protein